MSLDSTYHDMPGFERWASLTCRNSDDYKEGVRSFIEKRPPVFKGR